MNKKGKLLQLSIITVILYIFFSVVFFYIVRNQYSFNKEFKTTDNSKQELNTGPITNRDIVIQKIFPQYEFIKRVDLYIGTYDRLNTSKLNIYVIQNDIVLYEEKIDASSLKDNSYYTLKNNRVLKVDKGKDLFVKVTSDSNNTSNSIAIWYSKEMNNMLDNSLLVNGKKIEGYSLFLDIYCVEINYFKENYFKINIIIFTAIVTYLFLLNIGYIKKNKTRVYIFYIFIKKYSFLINRLVDRDFKTKYKRSFLGILWSLLNPLLTMVVQYVVFSNLFRFDIDNYVVYLLIGIILFNFFADATTQSISVILNNASLITKVYVPKIIYPLSKVISVSINLLLSFIPLVILTDLNGLPFNIYYLLIPFGVFLFLIFCAGWSLILSSLMVFFRDIQFLWGVFIMIWTYLTPIFYPESILPEVLKNFIKFNPLYQYIKFFRTILLDSMAPEQSNILFCIFFSILFFCVGYYIFKKTENDFILNI